MSRQRKLATLVALLGSLQAGCALTSKATPITPRYFSPELTPVSPAAAPALTASEPLTLRLGEVEAASHLEERMAYRVHASELGYHEDRLWTERPEEYVRRALESELFEHRHLRRIVSGGGMTLDVELTAFEELREAPARVRLALRFTLHDERESSLERSVVVEQKLLPDGSADHAQRVASALGGALTEAVADVSRDVVRALRTPPAGPAAVTGSAGLAKGISAPAPQSPSGSESR